MSYLLYNMRFSSVRHESQLAYTSLLYSETDVSSNNLGRIEFQIHDERRKIIYFFRHSLQN